MNTLTAISIAYKLSKKIMNLDRKRPVIKITYQRKRTTVFFASLKCFLMTYLHTGPIMKMQLKGQCHEIFCFWFFSSISFPPTPENPIWTVSNFFEISRRYSQLKVDHRCRWHRWQMKKIFNQKNLNRFIGTPLDGRVYTYIHFCLQVHFKVSAAWY